MSKERIDLDSHIVQRPLAGAQKWGVLDAPERKGIELYPEVDEALVKLSRLFDAEGYQFQLTAGGLLAMQQLLFHFYLHEVRQTGKNHFLSSEIEEGPILKALDRMEMMGCGVKLLSVDPNGQIDLQALQESIRPKTALLSISAVCAMTGVVQKIPEIVEICHAKGVKVHVNASHAIGTWGVSLKEWNVDYLTFDGDKLGAPQGVGGVFSRELIREGLASPSALILLAKALEDVTSRQEQFAMEMARLREAFEEELLRMIPGTTILGGEVERVPHIFAASFPGVMNEALLYALYRRNIEASIGGGQFQTISHLLQKCGQPTEVALGAVSFALSHHLKEDDLAEAVDAVVSSVKKLQKMSLNL